MNPGGRRCGEPRSHHCTPAWVTRAKLHLKKKKERKRKKGRKEEGKERERERKRKEGRKERKKERKKEKERKRERKEKKGLVEAGDLCTKNKLLTLEGSALKAEVKKNAHIS